MDKMNNSTDPNKTKSMLFRLFAGDRSAMKTENIHKDDHDELKVPTNEAQGEKEAVMPEVASTQQGEVVQVMEEPSSKEEAVQPHVPETADDGEAAANDNSSDKSAQGAEQAEEQAPAEVEAPVDAGIEVQISADGMEAYVSLTPPQNGGAEAGPKIIRTQLKAAGVTYGIIDRVMFEIAMSKPYNKGKILVAQGTPRQDGQDAQIVEAFSREIDISPYQNADGTVDFKRLNIVREVAEGTLIAHQEPPTEGKDGTSVRSENIKAKPGKPTQLLRGANTIISQDGMQLLAEKNGHLAFRDGRFNVDTVFTVNESVDNNTGNITFGGDVLIKGDVREGYTIHAIGAVRVKGTVEGGSIYSESDIIIDGGFNGMKRGELETSKNVTSKFLQNCTVKTKGDITSGSVVNSIIFCDGQLVVTKDKGVIVGGRCTVLYSVEAKVIGTDVNTPTQITVGLSPTVLAEKQEMEKAIEEVESSQDMLSKNLIYLERCAKMGKLSDKNMVLQEECNKQKVLIKVREATYRKRLEVVNATIEEAAAGSMVKVQTVYPSTKISIKSQSIITKTLQHRCIFRMEKGELITATY